MSHVYRNGLLTPPSSASGYRRSSKKGDVGGSTTAASLARASDEYRRSSFTVDGDGVVHDPEYRAFRTPAMGPSRPRKDDPDAPSSSSESEDEDDEPRAPLSLAQQRRLSSHAGASVNHLGLPSGSTTNGRLSARSASSPIGSVSSNYRPRTAGVTPGMSVRRPQEDQLEPPPLLASRPREPYSLPYTAAADSTYNPLMWKPAPKLERPQFIITPAAAARSQKSGSLAASFRNKPSTLRSTRTPFDEGDDRSSTVGSIGSGGGGGSRAPGSSIYGGGNNSSRRASADATGSGASQPPITAPDAASFFAAYQPSLHEPGRHKRAPHESGAMDQGMYGLKRSFAQFKLDSRMAVHRMKRKTGM